MKKQQPYQESAPSQTEQLNPELIEKNGKILIKNITTQQLGTESELYNVFDRAVNLILDKKY